MAKSIEQRRAESIAYFEGQQVVLVTTIAKHQARGFVPIDDLHKQLEQVHTTLDKLSQEPTAP